MSRVVYKEVVEFQCVHVHCCRVVILTRYVQGVHGSIHVHFGKWSHKFMGYCV